MKSSKELSQEWGLERYVAAIGIVSNKVVNRSEGWANWTQEELKALLDESRDAFDLFGVLASELMQK